MDAELVSDVIVRIINGFVRDHSDCTSIYPTRIIRSWTGHCEYLFSFKDVMLHWLQPTIVRINHRSQQLD